MQDIYRVTYKKTGSSKANNRFKLPVFYFVKASQTCLGKEVSMYNVSHRPGANMSLSSSTINVVVFAISKVSIQRDDGALFLCIGFIMKP